MKIKNEATGEERELEIRKEEEEKMRLRQKTEFEKPEVEEAEIEDEMEGEKQERLFGLVPRKFKKTAVVSAETGKLLETRQKLSDRILEFISF